MFIAFYITDSKDSLVFQYLLASNSPFFSHILARIRAVSPGLVSRDDDGDCRLALFHFNVSKDLEVYKYHSQINNLNYYCLEYMTDSRPHIETFTFLQLLDQTLLEYFDKDTLNVSKIIKNYDRITMIFYICINAGEPCVGSLNSNRIKRIIRPKSDLSKMINYTAQTIRRAVRQPYQGILASPSEKTLYDEVVPWRSGNLRYASDEIYVDVIETIHAIYQVNRHHHGSLKVVSSTINGQINVKCYLSGNPTVEMDLDLAGNENRMYTPSLHECIQVPQDSLSLLHFIPPDGICNLLHYTIDNDLDTDMNPSETKAPRMSNTGNTVGIVSVSYKDELGSNNDEFEIHVNISNSPSVPKIQDLKLKLQLQPHRQCLDDLQEQRQRSEAGLTAIEVDQDIEDEQDQVEGGKIKVLRNTHGRFDNSVQCGRGTWIFDSETSAGSLAVLRACIEHSKSPVKIQSVGVSYTHEGLLPSGIKLRKLNVISATSLREKSSGNKLFKGVKYVCHTGDYELRSM